MAKRIDFQVLDPLPSYFVNAEQELRSGAAYNFGLRVKPGVPTVLQVPAGPGDDQVGLVIDGRPRYITATVERAAIGGPARMLDLYATAADDVIVPGDPAPIDDTEYAFDLALVEAGADPAGVDLFRHVAEVAWNGSKFTAINLVVGGIVATSSTGVDDAIAYALVLG